MTASDFDATHQEAGEVVVWGPEANAGAGGSKTTGARWRRLTVPEATPGPPLQRRAPAWGEDWGSESEPEEVEVESPVTQRSRGGRLIFASRKKRGWPVPEPRPARPRRDRPAVQPGDGGSSGLDASSGDEGAARDASAATVGSRLLSADALGRSRPISVKRQRELEAKTQYAKRSCPPPGPRDANPPPRPMAKRAPKAQPMARSSAVSALGALEALLAPLRAMGAPIVPWEGAEDVVLAWLAVQALGPGAPPLVPTTGPAATSPAAPGPTAFEAVWALASDVLAAGATATTVPGLMTATQQARRRTPQQCRARYLTLLQAYRDAGGGALPAATLVGGTMAPGHLNGAPRPFDPGPYALGSLAGGTAAHAPLPLAPRTFPLGPPVLGALANGHCEASAALTPAAALHANVTNQAALQTGAAGGKRAMGSQLQALRRLLAALVKGSACCSIEAITRAMCEAEVAAADAAAQPHPPNGAAPGAAPGHVSSTPAAAEPRAAAAATLAELQALLGAGEVGSPRVAAAELVPGAGSIEAQTPLQASLAEAGAVWEAVRRAAGGSVRMVLRRLPVVAAAVRAGGTLAGTAALQQLLAPAPKPTTPQAPMGPLNASLAAGAFTTPPGTTAGAHHSDALRPIVQAAAGVHPETATPVAQSGIALLASSQRTAAVALPPAERASTAVLAVQPAPGAAMAFPQLGSAHVPPLLHSLPGLAGAPNVLGPAVVTANASSLPSAQQVLCTAPALSLAQAPRLPLPLGAASLGPAAAQLPALPTWPVAPPFVPPPPASRQQPAAKAPEPAPTLEPASASGPAVGELGLLGGERQGKWPVASNAAPALDATTVQALLHQALTRGQMLPAGLAAALQALVLQARAGPALAGALAPGGAACEPLLSGSSAYTPGVSHAMDILGALDVAIASTAASAGQAPGPGPPGSGPAAPAAPGPAGPAVGWPAQEAAPGVGQSSREAGLPN